MVWTTLDRRDGREVTCTLMNLVCALARARHGRLTDSERKKERKKRALALACTGRSIDVRGRPGRGSHQCGRWSLLPLALPCPSFPQVKRNHPRPRQPRTTTNCIVCIMRVPRFCCMGNGLWAANTASGRPHSGVLRVFPPSARIIALLSFFLFFLSFGVPPFPIISSSSSQPTPSRTYVRTLLQSKTQASRASSNGFLVSTRGAWQTTTADCTALPDCLIRLC